MMFRDLFFKLDYVWDFQFDWAEALEVYIKFKLKRAAKSNNSHFFNLKTHTWTQTLTKHSVEVEVIFEDRLIGVGSRDTRGKNKLQNIG